MRNPGGNRIAGWFGQFKLDGTAGLLLDDHSAISHAATGDNITDSQGYQVTASQLTVDRQIEQGLIMPFPFDLEPDTDGSDLPGLQGWFLTDESPFMAGFRHLWCFW